VVWACWHDVSHYIHLDTNVYNEIQIDKNSDKNDLLLNRRLKQLATTLSGRLPNIAIGKTSTGHAGKHIYFKYAALRLQCIIQQNAYARYAIALLALLQPPRRCIEYSVTNLQLPCRIGIAAG
jgi:hypothetical protein